MQHYTDTHQGSLGCGGMNRLAPEVSAAKGTPFQKVQATVSLTTPLTSPPDTVRVSYCKENAGQGARESAMKAHTHTSACKKGIVLVDWRQFP